MRDLVAQAIGKPMVSYGPGCVDCGNVSFFAYDAGARSGSTYLASLSPTPERIDSESISRVIGWIYAIDRQALPIVRKRPFGLDLPIVHGLTASDTSPAVPTALLFDLQHRAVGQVLGVSIDAQGVVYRYFSRHDEPLATRRVGKLEHDELRRSVQLAERSRHEGQRDESGGRICTTFSWTTAAQSEPVLFSNDCVSRTSGKHADALIAWIYAIDEQARAVAEPGWPPPEH